MMQEPRSILFLAAMALLVILGARSKRASEFERRKRRGDGVMRRRDFNGAIAAYTKAIELKPSNEPLYLAQAEAKRDKGDWDGTIADIAVLIEQRPTNAEAYIVQGTKRTVRKDENGRLT